MNRLRSLFLLSVFALGACSQGPAAVPFANGAAALKLPASFHTLRTNGLNSLVVASSETPGLEVRFEYQSMRHQVKVKPNITNEFIRGYAQTFGAESFSLRGSSTGALIQQPTNVGTSDAPSYESFGAVAFPEALITFKVKAAGAHGVEHIRAFNASPLRDLLSGLSANGA